VGGLVIVEKLIIRVGWGWVYNYISFGGGRVRCRLHPLAELHDYRDHNTEDVSVHDWKKVRVVSAPFLNLSLEFLTTSKVSLVYCVLTIL
jgi:hypothetical protein